MKLLIASLLMMFSSLTFAAPKAPTYQVDKTLETQRILADLKTDADTTIKMVKNSPAAEKMNIELTKAEKELKVLSKFTPPENMPYSLFP